MAIPDAATVAQKWETRTLAAAQDYVAGVQATQEDPTALAIAAGQRYIQRVTDAFNSGKWANGLRRVGKTGWQSATVAKATNFSTGVQGAQAKVQTAFTSLLAFEANLKTQIDAMPNVTLQDRIARAVAWINGMAGYQPPA